MADSRRAIRLKLVAFRYAPALGGAENHARRLMRQFGDRVDVEVFTLLTSNRTDWLRALTDPDRDQAERYEVDGRPVTAFARWPAAAQRKLRALTPLYHLPNSFAPGAMGKVLEPYMKPIVNNGDVVHNTFMGREAFSVAAMLAAHNSGLPFVFTPLRHKRPLGWNSPAFRKLYREADAVIALSDTEAAWLHSHGAPSDRLHRIGIGPLNDPLASTDLAAEIVPGQRNIVLFVGQLHRYKGVHALLGAAELLRSRSDVVFVFVGPDVRGNASLFANAGPNVRWLGAVDNATRDSLLNACTLLCVPSSRESFGGVLVEGWASGKPVIGGPAPATRELIDDGVDGWSVPQEPAAIASRVQALLDDPALAAAMGARGKEKVATRYSWEAIARAHLSVYEQVLSERPPTVAAAQGSSRYASGR